MNRDRGWETGHLLSVIRRLIPLLPVVMLVVAMQGPDRADAETGPWSEPAKISGDSVAGWFPDVAADDSGKVHVVWNGGIPGKPPLDAEDNSRFRQSAAIVVEGMTEALNYTRWDGRAWTKPNDIAVAVLGTALRSSIAVDGAGRVHLVRLGLGRLAPDSPNAEEWDAWYTSSEGTRAESAKAWSTPKKLSRDPSAYYSDMVIDSHGVIHVIWTETLGDSRGIFYARSADGGATWSNRLALDQGNFVWWYRAQLKIDDRDRLHVVWEVTDPRNLGMTRGMVYARSEDGGNTWSKSKFPDNLPPYPAYSDEGPGPQQPAVGVDGRGNTLIVWREPYTDRVLYQLSADGHSWSAPTPIGGVKSGVARPYDMYDMITDSSGAVHLVMAGYPTDSDVMSLLHVEWDGQNWSKPSVITGSPPFLEYPKLALSTGNRLHVVWFAGDRAGIDRNPLGIWYSTAETSAPRMATRVGVPPTLPNASAGSIAILGPTQAPAPGSPSEEGAKLQFARDDAGSSMPWVSDLQRLREYPLIAGITPVAFILMGMLMTKLRLFRR